MQKWKEYKDDAQKLCKYVNNIKNRQIIVTNAKDIYEICDCYNDYENVIKSTYFMLEYLNCGEKLLFVADYFM